MDHLTTSIANLGFPIVVSIYLLVRIEGKLIKPMGNDIVNIYK